MPSGHRPQPPIGTARVAISGRGVAGNTWVNVFWLNLTATTHVPADLASIVDSMVASYSTHLMANMTNGYTQTQAKASWLYASNSVLEYTGSYANTGQVASASLTDAVCAVLNWSITDYYRGGHPRTYIPGPAATHIGSGRILDSSTQTSIAAHGASFLTAVNALTHGGISAVALGTVRFASSNAWLTPPQFKAYQSASCRSILGTQRRRYAAY